MGQTRDMTGIELRARAKSKEVFRAYIADPDRVGRKLNGPWGTYEEAQEWRRRALRIKQDAKARDRAQREQAMLKKLEESLASRASKP